MDQSVFLNELKELIKQELGYLPEGDSLDELILSGELLHFPRRAQIIEAGKLSPDVYIVYKGIVRFVDSSGDRERTFGFALPGTIFVSQHSFSMNIPSYFCVEACCDTEILRIPKASYWNAVEKHHPLALFMLHYAHGELFYREYKDAAVLNGSAAEKFRSMLGDRPIIIEQVPQKIIASYLGVTPEYLSKLKRQFLKRRQ